VSRLEREEVLMFQITRTLVTAVCLGIVGVSPALAQTDPVVRHFADSTRVEVGKSRVIAFQLAEPTAEALALDAHVEPSGLVEVVRAPAVIEGERIGFVRVKGIAVGRATMSIGGVPIAIRVVEPFVAPDPSPRIVGPAMGAAVLGRVAVGVEVADVPGLESVTLRVSGGAEMSGELSPGGIGPQRWAVFELNTDDLPVGPVGLIAEVRVGALVHTSDPVYVEVIRPESMTTGEAEGEYDVVRPERFRDARRSVGRDNAASGGAYFSNASSIPAVCFPIEVDEPGRYQMIVTAAGTRAGGALPSVGLVIDGAQAPATNGRLLSTGWHRVAIGVPVQLEAGSHVLTPLFLNDFYAPQLADRNLRLDTIEIARLESSPASAHAGEGDPMMMMAMKPMAPMAMGGGGASIATDPSRDPMGLEPARVRIAFQTPLDGIPLAGRLDVRAMVLAPLADPTKDFAQTPVVSLDVNGQTVDRQRSLSPRFWIDPGVLRHGANTIQMTARLGGEIVAATPIQTLDYAAQPTHAEGGPLRSLRYSIHEENWDANVRASLTNTRGPPERFTAAMHAPGSIALSLPDDLAGEFDVYVECNGQAFNGPAKGRVTLNAGESATQIGEFAANTWWDMRRAGRALLTSGKKSLEIAFINDKYEEGAGDRNLFVQAIVLREVREHEDRSAPIVELAYPPDGHAVYMADAVVARAADDTTITYAELQIDEMRTPITRSYRETHGRIVLPLFARQLEPGEHTLSILTRDAAGNEGLSEIRRFIVLEEPPDEPGPYERALHLLDRLAFGPEERDLAAILTMGEEAWLDDRLGRDLEDAGELAAIGTGLTRFSGNLGAYQVSRRAIDHAIRTPNSVRTHFVYWTQNHFSTWIRKAQGDRKWREHARFMELGIAPFGDLLLASATSPAMLRYLDQDRSFSGNLNENYAREIMELHTLGVDAGYTQQDVTNLAGLLTGWTTSLEGDGASPGQPSAYAFRFDPALNDADARRVFGVEHSRARRSERFDRVLFELETLAAHPKTARHISRKLAEHYVSVPAPDALVDDLTEVYLTSGGDMRQMLRAVASHRAFWESRTSPRLAHPFQYAIRLMRMSRWDAPWQAGDYLDRSGAGLFDRPTPDGYPEEDAAYTDSNALIQRWSLAQSAKWPIIGRMPSGVRYTSNHENPEWEQLAVDALAVAVTGRVLSNNSNAAALDLIHATKGNSDQRCLTLATFVAQLPEASLR
jgi:Protein of unknown function (DUF1800)/Ca-dependent carbohydrate-binding module xylan-binding